MPASKAESTPKQVTVTSVPVPPPPRPDDVVRASWVDPSSFMNAEQARARDRFLKRMTPSAAAAKTADNKTEKGDGKESVAAASAKKKTADKAPPEVVAYPSTAPKAVAQSEPTSSAPGVHKPVALTSEEIVIGSSDHEPIEGGSGTRGSASPRGPRRRRRETQQRRRAVRRESNLSNQLTRAIVSESERWSVYSAPPASYYVAAPGCATSIDDLLSKRAAAQQAAVADLLAGEHRQQGVFTDEDVRAWAHPFLVEPSAGGAPQAEAGAGAAPQPLKSEVYVPMRTTAEARKPPAQHGRILESQRDKLPRCPPYRIPLYDQACFKHVFPNLFDSDFQFMEMFYWVLNLILVIVQIVMVIVNVFFNDQQSYVLPWVNTASVVIFSVEFGVTMALILFLIIVIVHACITRNIGTKLAQDVAALMTFVSTFSILRAVGLASPSFAMRRIVPQFIHAISFWDVLVGAGMVIVWLAVCLLAFVALIVKVTQIDFAYSTSITDWSFTQFVQLIGLLMNLARVDDSYFKEISVLLDAIHHHFAAPGEAREANSIEKPCLLARLMRALRIPNYMYYEYFDTIFNYHMDWARFEQPEEEGGRLGIVEKEKVNKKKKTYTLAYEGEKDAHEACTFDDIPTNMKWRNMFNYLSFVFEVDPIQLRRYLQMVQSPLPFYRVGRDSFLLSFVENDAVGMDMAVWRSDPISGRTRRYAQTDPSQFNLSFVCEDRRDLWDPEYKAKVEKVESREADKLIKALDKRNAAANSHDTLHAGATPQDDADDEGGELYSPLNAKSATEPISATEKRRVLLDREPRAPALVHEDSD